MGRLQQGLLALHLNMKPNYQKIVTVLGWGVEDYFSYVQVRIEILTSEFFHFFSNKLNIFHWRVWY